VVCVPRKNRPSRPQRGEAARGADPSRPLAATGERREQWQGEDYVVRSISGSAAGKEYRCPGCDQVIRPGVPHVVAWLEDDQDAGHRRHWHTACWGARDRRGPGIQRTRSAPRY
jgi:hypothetical protein